MYVFGYEICHWLRLLLIPKSPWILQWEFQGLESSKYCMENGLSPRSPGKIHEFT